MVVVARLADHYEARGVNHPLDAAEHDLHTFKHDAPRLWERLRASNMTNRQIGDWLYRFTQRWARSGMSFKNFAARAEGLVTTRSR